MIHLYTGNNLNYLVDTLGQFLYKKKHNVLSPHTIIVQSLGMQRWISLSLAKQHGVFLNGDFPFPQKFTEDVFKAVIPEYELSPLYNNKALVWLIVKVLPQCIDEKVFEPVKKYLTADGNISQVRLYQLAQRLANMYDEYIVYFYRDINNWENNGDHSAWQIVLWRHIKNIIDVNRQRYHKARIVHMAVNAIGDGRNKKALQEKLPEQIFIFGITALPEYYIALFNALSNVVPVHMFQLNPSKEYWFDVRSKKTRLRLEQKFKKKNVAFDDLHYETGNPLLASLGKVGQEYIGMLLDYDAQENIGDENNYHFVDDNCTHATVLASIQSDICQCIERGKGKHQKLPITPSDRSIAIHSCHSPLREVEVLRDYLLDVMNNSTITPNDIVVMAPDIDEYVPFVNAVFDEKVMRQEGLPPVPYCIADQSYKNTSRFISALSDVLEVMAGRLEADMVCALLDYDEIALKFGIGKKDVEMFHQWVEELNVKWGKDSAHRKQFTKHESDAFTWRYAIERLLMGYAVPQSYGLVDDIIPFDCVEGSSADVLEKIIHFFHSLFYFYDEAQEKKDLTQWEAYCSKVITEMLDTLEHHKDYTTLQNLITGLGAIEAEIGGNQKIEFLVIKEWIETFISEQRMGSKFLSAGITFCQLLPMRSIPFKVVCLLGMNDGRFPRLDENVSFDIMRNEIYKAKLPRCIRSKRNDDRYLFLESIISAQEYLFISYQGQSPIDLSRKEPSIAVNEMIEYIEKGFYLQDESQSIKNHLITNHHLHRFNPAYFQGDPYLFSYSKKWLEESKAVCSDKKSYMHLTAESIEEKETHYDITIDELIQFFLNPARHFITKVLGVRLRDEVISLESDELLAMASRLDKYMLNNDLIQWQLEGKDVQEYSIFIKKQCRVPDGVLGDVIIQNAYNEVDGFKNTVQKYASGDSQSLELKYTNCDKTTTINGTAAIFGHKQVFYRYADAKAKDLLKAFLRHIFVHAAGNAGIETFFIAKNSIYLFNALPEEIFQKNIEQCISFFKEGHKNILPFFPEIFHEYLDCSRNFFNKDRKESYSGTYIRNRIENVLYGDDFKRGDYEDSYIKRALYKVDFFDDENYKRFTEIAAAMYRMMNNCIKDVGR